MTCLNKPDIRHHDQTTQLHLDDATPNPAAHDQPQSDATSTSSPESRPGNPRGHQNPNRAAELPATPDPAAVAGVTPTALPAAAAGPPARCAKSNQSQPRTRHHPTRSAKKTPRLRWYLAIALAAALTATSCEWPPGLADNPMVVAALGGGSVAGRPPNVVPDDDDGGGGVLVDRVYVEARARLTDSGAVEVGARVNATALLWQPTQRLFDYDAAPVGEWWTSSPIGPATAGVSTVRIRARRLDDGSLELALLTPGGADVTPRQPQLTYAELTAGDWAYTSPVVLQADGEPAPPAQPTDNATHGGFTAISTTETRRLWAARRRHRRLLGPSTAFWRRVCR